MPVSKSAPDRRSCPACGTEVVSDIWLVVHRHERPRLWSRAPQLHTLTCPNGHVGRIRAPLVLFDPAAPYVIFSSGKGRTAEEEQAERDHLVGHVWQALTADERKTPFRIELVPNELLQQVLEDPLMNLADMAPGAKATEDAMGICAAMREGGANFDTLRSWLDDARFDDALRAGIRFELATALGNANDDVTMMEEAISEWQQTIEFYDSAGMSRRSAIASTELALCYSKRREANRAANLREALRLLDAGLEVLTAERYPEDFAMTQSRRGSLLLDMGQGPAIVGQSVASYRAALQIYDCRSYADDRALVLSNLATAYLAGGGKGGLDDLRSGVAALEEALTLRNPRVHPRGWAISQMNLGMALSHLPDTEPHEPHLRAERALRIAHELSTVLEDDGIRQAAAYNLGITLARGTGDSQLEEAAGLLEAALPSLQRSGLTVEFLDAVDCLAGVFRRWLEGANSAERGEAIARRALLALQGHAERTSVIRTNGEVATWLLKNSERRPGLLELVETALGRVLEATNSPEYSEVRAGALANLATFYLIRPSASKELDRARADDCLIEAVRILRSLPPTPERDANIGQILMNRTRSGNAALGARKL
jgi:tetratricopeptide (TPR) repeat protein